MDNKIERINEMEQRFNRASASLQRLENALQEFLLVQEDMDILSSYYSGGQWRRDYEADEAGRFPADLPRGVLSEDGIYNLLLENDELKERLNMTEAAGKAAED